MADGRQRGSIGLLGPALRYQGPTRVVGTTQNGGPWVPAECPKCHVAPPTWVQGDVSRCIACGTRWYQTRYTFEPSARRHRALHPVRLPEEATA